MPHPFLQKFQLEVTPEDFDVVPVVDLQHQLPRHLANEFILQVCHGNTIQPGLNMIALNTQAQLVPFAHLQHLLLLVGNLLQPATSVGLIDATCIITLGGNFALPSMHLVEPLDVGMEKEAAVAVALLLELHRKVEILVVLSRTEIAVLLVVAILDNQITFLVHTPLAIATRFPSRQVLTVEKAHLCPTLSQGIFLRLTRDKRHSHQGHYSHEQKSCILHLFPIILYTVSPIFHTTNIVNIFQITQPCRRENVNS